MDRVRITTPLGDKLLFESLSGQEMLSGAFHLDLMLLSEDGAIDLSALLGQQVTVEVDLPDSALRYFNGVVSSFQLAGSSSRFYRYRAVVRPWFWLLSLGSDCRIFQQMTVLDIVKQIFRDRGFSDFRDATQGTYRKWDFSVQYRESDFNYISRLLEQEGIYYFWEHADGKHTLVLADSISAHSPAPGFEEVKFVEPGEATAGERDFVIDHWTVGRQMGPGVYTTTDFDFIVPKTPLLATLKRPPDQEHDDYEIYDYPGEYLTVAEGNKQVSVRLEEQQAELETTHAAGSVRGIGPGMLFKLVGFNREDQNVEYLVVSASYEMSTNRFESGDSGGGEEDFRGSYTCIPRTQTYRAASHTLKPRVDGPQTATVVGHSGAEIWTDQYGRVKVQFHWDREGKHNEESSCWVRVSQLWAGSGWGGLHVPRIGQEVIVDFLEGDPDRPIITGRVYNGVQLPPYLDPKAPSDTATQSGIKSHSTPGGGPNNYNEIKFEDKKGKEEMHFQAERDQSTLVKRNQSITVGGSRTVSVGGTESIDITGKETQTYKNDRQMTVTGTNTDEVHKLHTGKYLLGRTEEVSGGEDKLTVSGQDKTVHVTNKYNITADAHYKVNQGANSILLEKKIVITNDGSCTITLDGPNTTVDAPSKIALTCGGSSITLSSDGTIEITGKTVKIGNANNNATFDPQGTTINGVKISASAVGIHEIAGALIKIG